MKEGILIDNRWVISHNINLVVKFQAHINVEWYNQGWSIKYLFKYANKGRDRSTFIVEENVSTENQIIIKLDEIKKVFRLSKD